MKGSLILVGMPACGKSTVGVILAKMLGKDFVDTDLVLQRRTGLHLSQLLQRGRDSFMREEEEALLSIGKGTSAVIATGGSAVYSQRGMAHLKALGPCLYLEVPYEALVGRLRDMQGRGVVLGAGQTLLDLYRERVPLYQRYADFTVNEAGLDLEGVVRACLRTIENGGNHQDAEG